MGLYPDGGTLVYVMGIPTIDSNNHIGSYDSLYVYNGEESGIKAVQVDDDSMELVYENGYIRVTSKQHTTARLEIFNSVGQQTRSERMNLQVGETSAYVGNMSAGVYIAIVTDANGVTGSCKFIIK